MLRKQRTKPARWQWTRHAVDRMTARWPHLTLDAIEAALNKADYITTRRGQDVWSAPMPGEEAYATFITEAGAVITGYNYNPNWAAELPAETAA